MKHLNELKLHGIDLSRHGKEKEFNHDFFKKQIIEAYLWIRANNNTIPDEVLDFMKLAALEKLDKKD